MTTKPFQLGSISTGTLRVQDLLEAFLPYVEPDADDAGEAKGVLARIANNDWPVGVANFEEYCAEFDTAELLQSIIDQMNCPPFIYFGAHAGDGADFGFWVDVEAIGEAIRYETESDESVSGDHVLPNENVIIQINDHGNATCYDMERNVIWSCV